MRALAACLTAIVGLGIASMAACSSTSDDTGSGGSAGTSTAGTAGTGTTAGTSSGGTSSAGTSSGGSGNDTGAAGAVGCPGLDANGCEDCFTGMCTDSEGACDNDDSCNQAITGFLFCACDDATKIPSCADTFNGTGTLAKAVVDCAKANCAAKCGL